MRLTNRNGIKSGEMEGIVNLLEEIEENKVRIIDNQLVNKNIGMQSDHKTTKSQRRSNDI